MSVLLQQGQGRLRIPVRGVAESPAAEQNAVETASAAEPEAPSNLVDALDRSGEPAPPVSEK